MTKVEGSSVFSLLVLSLLCVWLPALLTKWIILTVDLHPVRNLTFLFLKVYNLLIQLILTYCKLQKLMIIFVFFFNQFFSVLSLKLNEQFVLFIFKWISTNRQSMSSLSGTTNTRKMYCNNFKHEIKLKQTNWFLPIFCITFSSVHLWCYHNDTIIVVKTDHMSIRYSKSHDVTQAQWLT